MNHLPYIAAAYGLTLALIVWLSTDALLRTMRARRRLAAIDPRAERAP